MKKMNGALLALSGLLLAGCGDSDVREVRSWMEETKAQTKPAVKPLPASKEFVPYAYNQAGTVDPFNPAKLAGPGGVGQEKHDPLQPDLNRPREVLENYPLDTMRMVGMMEKGGVSFALVQIERSVYRVRAGQRLGQNFGQVTRVTPVAVEIREMVQDAAGDWVERISKLELQESKESGK
ncbi:pilus assembly protein PilP [Massilia sp. Dwa41.01b]|uniref:pilus assembly protein PilP n=1 Tax=unclassified Massilia TaxID=2609279 RepID=UPI001600C1E1|nr:MULTISPECIES: pilus assembly protein PilP [unclassified Massilia]QNA87641.1 pilus assembly protein PilP [Massilia sp. Dwa41.01b]QNA98546.1 pilus assembly protein PilP [Massilia sp. Se16.2.3]